eukprot:206122-Amphidinium_carterae.1
MCVHTAVSKFAVWSWCYSGEEDENDKNTDVPQRNRVWRVPDSHRRKGHRYDQDKRDPESVNSIPPTPPNAPRE